MFAVIEILRDVYARNFSQQIPHQCHKVYTIFAELILVIETSYLVFSVKQLRCKCILRCCQHMANSSNCNAKLSY